MWLRFRIRTLMLVVVGVALVSAVLVELPEIAYFLILLIPAVGPLIGASWVVRRYQPGGFDPISGGLAGGFLQATLIVLIATFVFACQVFTGTVTASWFLDWCLLVLGPVFLALLALHGVYGLMSGLLVSWCLLASPLLGRASREAKKQTPERGHGSPSTDDPRVWNSYRGLRVMNTADDESEDAIQPFHEVATPFTEDEFLRGSTRRRNDPTSLGNGAGRKGQMRSPDPTPKKPRLCSCDQAPASR